jgi:hypothetical protein
MAFLPGDGDETEVANTRPCGPGMAVDHDDALSRPRRRQRMGQSHYTAADHRDVELNARTRHCLPVTVL